MIITCNQCNKKFDVKDNLIPPEGRLLECSSCLNRWFYKNKENLLDETLPIQIYDEIKNNEEKITVKAPHIQTNHDSKDNNISNKIIQNDKIEKENNKEIKDKKTSKVLGFLKLIIIFIISIIALIILIDTFRTPITLFIPNIDFILNNLYQTLIDLFLFFKDLI
jgi:predicted Zn finger-like uncharacterized protein